MRHSPIPRFGLSQALRRGGIALLAVVLVSCASRTRAPVEDRTALPAPPPATASATMPPPAPAPGSPSEAESRGATYTVKRGDTLYQIALDHGLDYKDLAAWNNLENANKILTGQVLRVTAPGDATTGTGVTTAPLKVAPAVTEARTGAIGVPPPAATSSPPAVRNADNYKSSPKAFKEPYSEQALRDVARASQAPAEVAAAAPASAAQARTAALSYVHRRAGPGGGSGRRGQTRLGMAGEGQGRRRLFRDGQPEGHRHRGRGRRARHCQRQRQGCLRRQRPARLRQARHRQTQQDVAVGLRAQPGNPGEGRPAGREGSEDRGNGQHRRRPGETAFRNPAAGQAGGSRQVPSGRMSARPREPPRRIATRGRRRAGHG